MIRPLRDDRDRRMPRVLQAHLHVEILLRSERRVLQSIQLAADRSPLSSMLSGPALQQSVQTQCAARRPCKGYLRRSLTACRRGSQRGESQRPILPPTDVRFAAERSARCSYRARTGPSSGLQAKLSQSKLFWRVGAAVVVDSLASKGQRPS